MTDRVGGFHYAAGTVLQSAFLYLNSILRCAVMSSTTQHGAWSRNIQLVFIGKADKAFLSEAESCSLLHVLNYITFIMSPFPRGVWTGTCPAGNTFQREWNQLSPGAKTHLPGRLGQINRIPSVAWSSETHKQRKHYYQQHLFLISVASFHVHQQHRIHLEDCKQVNYYI